MEEKLKKEDFDTIKKFLKQMDKTFLDAKSCRSCRESCGDIFYNKYEKVYDLVVDIEEQFFELTKKIAELEDIEKEDKKVLNFVNEETEIEEEEEIEFGPIKIQEPFM